MPSRPTLCSRADSRNTILRTSVRQLRASGNLVTVNVIPFSDIEPRPTSKCANNGREHMQQYTNTGGSPEGRSSSTRRRSRQRHLVLEGPARNDLMSVSHRPRELPHEFNEKFDNRAQGSAL